MFQCVMCSLTYGFMTCLSLIPGQTYRYDDENERYGGSRDRRHRRDGGSDSQRYGRRGEGGVGNEHARDGFDGRSRRFSGEAGSVRIRDERRSRYSFIIIFSFEQ